MQARQMHSRERKLKREQENGDSDKIVAWWHCILWTRSRIIIQTHSDLETGFLTLGHFRRWNCLMRQATIRQTVTPAPQTQACDRDSQSENLKAFTFTQQHPRLNTCKAQNRARERETKQERQRQREREREYRIWRRRHLICQGSNWEFKRCNWTHILSGWVWLVMRFVRTN